MRPVYAACFALSGTTDPVFVVAAVLATPVERADLPPLPERRDPALRGGVSSCF